jgi:hypothetical protein
MELVLHFETPVSLNNTINYSVRLFLFNKLMETKMCSDHIFPLTHLSYRERCLTVPSDVPHRFAALANDPFTCVLTSFRC